MCRELRPAASEGRKPESWSSAPWKVRGWNAKQPWCISSPRMLFTMVLVTWDSSAPSLLSVQLPESLQHYTSCPCFVLNQPSPNAAWLLWLSVGEFQNPTAPLTAIASSSRNWKDSGSATFPRAAQSFCWDAAMHAGYQTPWSQLLPLNYSKTV